MKWLEALLQQASGQIFKDDVNGFSSTSDICFLHGEGRSGPSQEPHRGETSAYYLMIMHIYPGLTPGKMDQASPPSTPINSRRGEEWGTAVFIHTCREAFFSFSLTVQRREFQSENLDSQPRSAELSGLTPGVSYCSVESAVSQPAVYTGLQWTLSPRQSAEAKPNLSQLYHSWLSLVKPAELNFFKTSASGCFYLR